MLISQFPTFSYITWQGLIISSEGIPYVINDANTDCKYIYWEVEQPYMLKATNEKLPTSLARYLIYINDNGIATEVPQDMITIQYRESTGGALVSKISAQVNELDGKYYAIREDIDGLEQIIGSNETTEEGSIIDRINTIEQTANSTVESISQLQTTYNNDKEIQTLKDNVLSSLIAMSTALSEYQEVIMDAYEDFKITVEEEALILENQTNLLEKINDVEAYHDELATKSLNESNEDDFAKLHEARENLRNAINDLNTQVNTHISDSTVVPSEITIALSMLSNVGVKANDYKEILSDCVVLGIGGEVVENAFVSNKTATNFTQKMSEIVEVIDGETGLKTQIEANTTAIEQTAQDLKLNYMKYDTVTSEITVSDNLIKLDAGKVLLTGTLTWDSLDSIAKENLKGEKGVAEYVMLTGDQFIKYDTNGYPSRDSVSINLLISGIDETRPIVWKYRNEGSDKWISISSNNDMTYYTLKENSSIWNNEDTITIRAIVDNTYYDDLTIVKVYDGLDGSLAEYVEINGENIFKYTIKTGDTTFTPTPNNIILEGLVHNINTNNTKWYYKKPNEVEWTLMGAYNGLFSITVNSDDNILFTDNDVVQIKFELNTHYDITTITKVYDGKDSVMAFLSNENHIIPCKSDGTPIDGAFDNAETSLNIYVGNINDTNNWRIETTLEGIEGEFPNNNTFKINGFLEGFETGYLDFIAEKNDFDRITKRFTISKSKNGLDGSRGEDSISYWINSSASAIVKKVEGGFEPPTLEVNAKSKEGKKEIQDSNGIFKIYEKVEEEWVEKYVSSSEESQYTYTIENPSMVKIGFYINEVLIDEEYIPVVVDGETTPLALLSNDSHIIPCNFNGNPLNYEGATTTMSIYIGSVDDSANWIYTITENGVIGSISEDGRTYTVTTINEDVAYVDIVATKEGYEQLTRRFTVTKSINGEDGESAKYIYIVGEQVFRYEEDFNGDPTPSMITLTANKYNIESSGMWQYKDSQGNYVDMNTTSDTIDITPISGILGENNLCVFRYVVDELYDEMTIVKLSNGSNGLPGSDGEDSIYILLTNETHVVPCDSNGEYTESELEKAKTEIHVYKGLDEISYTVRLEPIGCQATYDNANKTVTLTSLLEKSAQVKIMIDVENRTFEKIMTVVKSIQGADGKDGNGINIMGILDSTDDLPSDGSPGDAYLINGLLYLWSENNSAWSEGTPIRGEQGLPGKDGIDGKTTYFHIKYSNDGGKTFTSNNGEDVGDWLGQYTDFYEDDSTTPSHYNWKKIKGEDGEHGIVASLSNDTHTVPCSADGINCIFIGCSSKISLFSGANEITDGVSYSYVIVEGSGNTGVKWDSATGTIEITEMNNIDVACIDLTATYNGIGYTKRFTVTKSKKGAGAITVNLDNDNHSFVANSSGVIENQQSVTIKIIAYKDDIPISVGIGGIASVNGLKITTNSDESSITLTTVTTTQLAQSGVIDIPIVADNLSFTKQFTYTRVDCGEDGVDGYTVTLSNENHSFYCESNGTILDIQSAITEVVAFYGSEKRNVTIGTINGVPNGMSAEVNGSSVTITVYPYGHSDYADIVSNGSFNIPVTVDGRNFVKVFSWSKAFKGTDGKDGEDAKYVIVNGEQVFRYPKNSATPTPPSISLNASKFGATSNGKWQYKYNDEWVDLGQTATNVTITPTSGGLNYDNSCTFRYIVDTYYDEITIVKIYDGVDGVTNYTWVMYADDENGNGISNDPTDKEYIGLAYNKTTATESTNPGDYSWSLIKGADGINGEKGEDGKTYYTWIKYSDNSDGTILYDTPTADTKYIGIATNKTSQTESTDKNDYTWSKFRGEQGVPGNDGYTVVLTNESHGFPCESTGNIPSQITTSCQVLAYRGTTPITPTIGAITSPEGLSITKNDTTINITATVGTSLADNGTVEIPVIIDGVTFSKIFSWTKIYKGEKGETGDAELPDWIEEWDGSKTTLNGSTILTPKIFAGTITGGVPTGVALGMNVFGTTGTYTNVNGMVGYKNGTKLYEYSSTGTILWGDKNGQYLSWDGSNIEMNVNSLTISAKNVATDSSVDGKISDVNNTINGIEGRVSAVETKVDSDSIVSTVTNSTSWSQVSQTANKVNWIIKSGTSSSNMALTSDALKVIAENIDLTGLVTFNSFDSYLQGEMETLTDVSNWKYGNTTKIDGGQIHTNTITADKIDVTDLAVKGELLVGIINGVYGIYLGTGASIYGAMYGYKTRDDTIERWRISSDGWGSFDGAEFDSDVTIGNQLTTNGNIVGKGNLTLDGTIFVNTVNNDTYNWRVSSAGWGYFKGGIQSDGVITAISDVNVTGNLNVSAINKTTDDWRITSAGWGYFYGLNTDSTCNFGSSVTVEGTTYLEGNVYIDGTPYSDGYNSSSYSWRVTSAGWCYFESGGQFDANVTCAGRITGGSFYTTGGTYIGSDRNIKENIQYINSQSNQSRARMLLNEPESNSLTTSDMLEFIETIPLVKYDLKEGYEFEENATHYGFIIQDIADTKVGKEITHTPNENDDIAYMTYSEENLITVLIGALQAEIQARKSLEQYVMNMKGE